MAKNVINAKTYTKNVQKQTISLHIPVIPQIKEVLNKQLDIIVDYLDHIHGGNLYRKLKEKHNEKLLSLTLNVVSANIFRSNKSSLWILQLVQNYLPPDIRFCSFSKMTKRQ